MEPQSPNRQPNNPYEPPAPQQVFKPAPTPTYTTAPAAPQQPNQPQSPDSPAYDFIVNPNKAKVKQPLLGNTSLPIKIGLVAGGLLVLFIIFTVLKGLVGGSSNLAPYVGVAQDQQELIHLVTAAGEQKDLSTTNQNFAATANLSLKTSQSEVLKYLRKNGQKVTVKQLALKISASTDSQLQAAAEATTYNQTFQDIMKTKLAAYSRDLQQAYNQSKGAKGKALLSDQFDQADLLQTQLKSQ